MVAVKYVLAVLLPLTALITTALVAPLTPAAIPDVESYTVLTSRASTTTSAPSTTTPTVSTAPTAVPSSTVSRASTTPTGLGAGGATTATTPQTLSTTTTAVATTEASPTTTAGAGQGFNPLFFAALVLAAAILVFAAFKRLVRRGEVLKAPS